jgi:DNA-directed RNA polymerase subunit RPC12/RpoP
MENATCKKCGSKNIVMVEYPGESPEHYDGVSEIDCVDCGARFGKWSGKELAEGEVEKKFGRKNSI